MKGIIQTHGGNVNKEAQELNCSIEHLLDSSSSLVPFDPPFHLRRCLHKCINSRTLRDYPDREQNNLINAISSWHCIDPEMILPGNGAAELFTWAAKDAGKKGISGLPSPGFSDYSRALRCWDASYFEFSLPLEWSNETPQVFPLKPNSNVIWITNPHNPTGQLWSQKSIRDLIKRYSLIICDEAFLPLVPNGEKQSLIPLVKTNPNLIVIRSLTKLFGIAGLRLGYAISYPDRIDRWKKLRDPWPVNGLALEAGTILMNERFLMQKWLNKVHSWVTKEGQWMYKNLSLINGIEPQHSSCNFLLIKGDNSLIPLRNYLAKEKILLRDCRSFKALGENWLRIGLQSQKNNNRIIKKIRKFIS